MTHQAAVRVWFVKNRNPIQRVWFKQTPLNFTGVAPPNTTDAEWTQTREDRKPGPNMEHQKSTVRFQYVYADNIMKKFNTDNTQLFH